MKYLKSNPHPLGKKIGDCAVRAICYALEKHWDDAYILLCDSGLEMKQMPNNREVIDRVLINEGFTKHGMLKDENNKRFSVEQIADLHPKKTIVVSLIGHYATIVEGELLDSWNCKNKKVGIYYTR
jgi:hypothetical protein